MHLVRAGAYCVAGRHKLRRESPGAYRFYEEHWRRTSPSSSNPTTDARWRKLARALGRLPKGARVLDYGCGNGLFAARLASAGYRVTGVDISETALEVARANAPGAEFFNVEEEDSWLLPQRYDACWCSEVLEHLFSPSEALRKIACALKPEGALWGTVPYHGLLKNLAISFFGFDRHFDLEGGHIRFFTRRSLTKIIRASGLEPVRWSGVGRTWPTPRSF